MVASGDRPSPTEAAAETAPFEKLIISKNKNPPSHNGKPVSFAY